MQPEEKLQHVEMLESFDHYGRKGMKWYQHIFGDEETRNAKRIAKLEKRDYIRKDRSLKSYGDTTLPAGATVYRTDSAKKGSLSDFTYVSRNQIDRMAYRTISMDKNNTGRYEHEYKLNKDTKIAGIETTRKAMGELLKKPQFKNMLVDGLFLNAAMSTGRDAATASQALHLVKNKKELSKDPDYESMFSLYKASKEAAKKMKLSKDDQIDRAQMFLAAHKEFKKALADSLQKKGYSGMYDDNTIGVGTKLDANGGKLIGQESYVLFSPDVAEKKSRSLGPQTMADSYKEWRKISSAQLEYDWRKNPNRMTKDQAKRNFAMQELSKAKRTTVARAATVGVLSAVSGAIFGLLQSGGFVPAAVLLGAQAGMVGTNAVGARTAIDVKNSIRKKAKDKGYSEKMVEAMAELGTDLVNLSPKDREEFDKYFGDIEFKHYGRKGMKWYQHIYGNYEKGAKYVKKAATKAVASYKGKMEKLGEANAQRIAKSKQAKAVRKAQAAEAKEARKAIKAEHDKVVRAKKAPEKMSNDELRTATDRLKLINEYNEQYAKAYPDPKQAKRERNRELVNMLMKTAIKEGLPLAMKYVYEKNSIQVKADAKEAEAELVKAESNRNKEQRANRDEKRVRLNTKIKTLQNKSDRLTSKRNALTKKIKGAKDESERRRLLAKIDSIDSQIDRVNFRLNLRAIRLEGKNERVWRKQQRLLKKQKQIRPA